MLNSQRDDSMSFGLANPPRLAVVGCSWFARAAHLPALRLLESEGLVEVVALCSRSNESLASARQFFDHDIETYTSFETLLAQSGIDVVDLVLPTPIINSAIKSAFRAGKHVISEKPCAATLDQCRDLLAEYNRYDGKLSWSVAENWPFKPTVQCLLSTIKNCNFGEIRSIDFKFLVCNSGGAGWRLSSQYRGGYVLDSGVHFVSMLRLLTGGIRDVDASVEWRAPDYAAHKVVAGMNFEKNVTGKFTVSFAETQISGDPEDRYQAVIKFDGATIKADLVNCQVVVEVGNATKTIDMPNDPWVQGGVYPMLRHCCEALSGGYESSCSPIEAMKDVAVIEAMIESSRLGRPVAPALLHDALTGCRGPVRTFARLQDFRPSHLAEAASVSDIRVAIREASSQGLKVRSAGAGNTWSKYIATSGVSIRTLGLDKIYKVCREENTISVGAGVQIGDMTKKLSESNLCLPSLPFLTTATIGGAISTAMHGTSPHWGTVSDFVKSMTLVTALGDVITVDAAADYELLRAARVSVGMLGVIANLELRAIPMRWVRNVRIDATLDEFITHQDELFARYEHLWIHWIVGEDRFVMQCLESRGEPEDGFSPYVSGDGANWVKLYQASLAPPSADSVMLSMQYGIPLSELAHVIRRLNETKFAHEHRQKEIEIKFLKKDDAAHLGPNSDYDAALLNTWWPVDRGSVNRVFVDLEENLRALKARPHWGKHHSIPDLEYIEMTYPNWGKFESIRKELDPKGMFSIFTE